MKSMLIASALVIGMAASATAQPAKLTSRQLDTVTAGAIVFPGGPYGPPPIGPLPPTRIPPTRMPPTPLPVSPPVFTGGPILISCIVGVGCTARHY